MAITLSTEGRNLAADAIADHFDSQAGELEIRDSSTVLATITLPTPAFGASATGVVAKSGTWEDTSADATGTADNFILKDNGGDAIISGSVGGSASGEDIELDNTSITSGQTVTITSFSFTMPAS